MPLPIAAVGIGIAVRAAAVWLVAKAAQWVPTLVGQILLALGIKFVLFDTAIQNITDQVISRFNLVSGSIMETMYYCNVDDFVGIILSALLAVQTGRIMLRRRA